MPKIPPALTNLAIENLKPKKTIYTRPDGAGLFIRVSPTGLKTWLSRYRDNEGKRGLVVIGKYPIMSLADARLKNEEIQANALKDKTAIISYREQKKLDRLGTTKERLEQERLQEEIKKRCFMVVGNLWLKEYRLRVADSTYNKAEMILENCLYPSIGDIDVAKLGRFDVDDVLLKLSNNAPAQAKQAISYIRQIIDFAIENRLRDEFTEINFNKVVKRIPQSGHLPAITNTKDLAELLGAIDGYEGVYVKNALYLCLWTGHRPYIVASAKWSEIDLNTGVWLVSGYEEEQYKNGLKKLRMKMGQDHIVSLPSQAIEMLKEMYKISGGGVYVFPPLNVRSKIPHLSRDAISKALRVMGFAGKHCTHGFRALIRTVAREELGADADILEAQLAHSKRSDNNKGAYDRTLFIKKRVDVMQEWADYLDSIRAKNKPPLELVS